MPVQLKDPNELLKLARESMEAGDKRAKEHGNDDTTALFRRDEGARLYAALDKAIMETGKLPSKWSGSVFDHRYVMEEKPIGG